MADQEVLISLQLVQKGDKISIVTKDTEKLSKSTGKLADEQDKAFKGASNHHKGLKGVGSAGANTTKNFSKMNQALGGSGGLVASYALLAANVFAITAAFNTFSQAAAVEKLAEGLTQFSNTTGMSLDLVSQRLQEATGNAVSFEMAMKTAALSTSAGFGTAEMEGLTRVAKGASLALGRDMGDALDRLTRGAIKLEPEILDELGIMVRLDDATESYAVTLGKSAAQLTRFEKQQAFMNAIITEGTEKFGDIGESIDPNAYDTLSAAFTDLSKGVLNFMNGALIPMINFIVKVPGLFLGAVMIFAGGITKRMIPALTEMSSKGLLAAQNAADMADSHVTAQEQMFVANTKNMKSVDGTAKAFNGLFDKFKKGNVTQKEVITMQKSLGGSISALVRKQKKLTDQGSDLSKEDKKRLNQLQENQKALKGVTAEELKSINARMRAKGASDALVVAKEAEISVMQRATEQTFTLRESMRQIKDVTWQTISAAKAYGMSLYEAATAEGTVNFATIILAFSMSTLKAAFFGAGLGAKAFGTMLLNAIPIIGQIIFFAQLAIGVLKWLAGLIGIGSEEQKAANDAYEDLQKTLTGIPGKIEALEKAQKKAVGSVTTWTKQYKILGGLIKTITDEAINAEIKARKAGEGFWNGYDANKTVRIGALGTDEKLVKRAGDLSPTILAITELNSASEEYAKFFTNRLGVPLEEFIAEAVKAKMPVFELADSFSDLMVEGEAAFNGVAAASEDMQRAFGEAEKETQKFFQGTTETTKFDGISQEIDSLSNSLISLTKESVDAGMSIDQQSAIITEAMTKMGAGTASLMGAGFVEDEATRKKLTQERLTQQQLLQKTVNEEQRNSIKAEIERIENELIPVNNRLANAIREQLPATKALLDNLIRRTITSKKELKFMQDRKKAVLAIAKNEWTIVAAAKMQDAINVKRVNLLRDEQKLKEGELEKIRQKQIEGAMLTKDELQVLADEQRILTEIGTLENKISDTKVNQLQAEIAKQKALEANLVLTNKIANQTQKAEQAWAQLMNQQSGMGKMSPAGLAQQEVEAAKEAYNQALASAKIKMAIIAAEFNLLSAQSMVEKTKNSGRIAQIKVQQNQEKADRLRIEELDAKRTSSIQTGKDPLTGNEESELSNLKARQTAAGELIGESAALSDLNDALDQTITSALDIVRLKTEGSVQDIFDAALSYETKVFESFSSLGENLLSSAGGGTALADVMANIAVTPIEKARADMQKEVDALMKKKEALPEGATLGEAEIAALDRYQEKIKEIDEKLTNTNHKLASQFAMMGSAISSMFGEDGAVIAGLMNLTSTTITAFDTIKEKGLNSAEGIQAIGNIMNQVASIAAASSKQKIAAIDADIAAEKKKDGKSTESLAKIKAMERKKEEMQKKAFETNKKMQMASIIANTAAGVMKTIGETGFFGTPLAMIVAAMGAMQLAMVASTSFKGGSSSIEAPKKQNLSIGKRGSSIDVSRGASSGELGFLRGQRGGAAGMKSYAPGGVIIGERGPEEITPMGSFEITPNDKIGERGVSNVNFNINAVDASSVEQLLTEQRGNIIGMIREAANDTGEYFLENVDTQAMGGDIGDGGY